MDVRAYNRDAWDGSVLRGNRWTVPVTSEQVAAARRGEWSIVLTPQKPVPRSWFPDLRGLDVLALASGGGQQGPILAAAGANVTVFDNSPRQLERDRMVAQRDGLAIATVEGDMADLSAFGAGSFDLIVHPVSNCFVPSIRPVWREASRVLRRGGALLAGFCDPVLFALDPELAKSGVVTLRYPVPFSDLASPGPEERAARLATGEPLEFGHTLCDQIGGQVDAGLVITGMYDDRFDEPDEPLSRLMPCFYATRAVKA